MTENGGREQLENRATAVRTALERHLNVIDHRRQRVTEAARSVARPAAVVTAAALILAGGVLIAKRIRARRAPERYTAQLSEFLGLAPVRRQKGFLLRGLERAALSLVAVAAQRLGTHGLDLLASAAAPNGQRPAVPRPKGTRDRTAW